MSAKVKELHQDIETMVASLSLNELREAAVLMAASSNEAKHQLLDFLAAHGKNSEELTKAQRERMEQAEDKFEDIWEDAVVVLHAMEEGDWEELTERGFKDYYFEDANIDEQLANLKEIVRKEKLSEEFRRRMMEEMVDEIVSSEYCGDEELDLVESLCYTNEDLAYLAEILQEEDSYSVKNHLSRIMKKLSTEEDYMAFLQEESDDPESALELYRMLNAKGRREEAEDILWQCFEGRPSDLALINELLNIAVEKNRLELFDRLFSVLYKKFYGCDKELFERMYTFARKFQDNDRTDRLLLWAYVGYLGNNETAVWFDRCRSEMTPAFFDEHRYGILDKLKTRCPDRYLTWLIAEGRKEEALEALMADKTYASQDRYVNRLDQNHQVSSKLLADYPEEIQKRYWMEAAACGLNKDRYADCARVLALLKSIAQNRGTLKEWEERYKAFVDEHKRRRYLMDALRRDGLL